MILMTFAEIKAYYNTHSNFGTTYTFGSSMFDIVE